MTEMTELKFIPFPKMARLSREVVITEKIDGTNAQILVLDLPDDEEMPTGTPIIAVCGRRLIYAGSRNRWLTPSNDNHGFATWVQDNAEELAKLPVGRHFGEWWGSGIQRGYGLSKGEKRLSLFNVQRFHLHGQPPKIEMTEDPRVFKESIELPRCVSLVPVLYQGVFDTTVADRVCDQLRDGGSHASPFFMDPEGVIVYHVAAGVGFKKTLVNDDKPKGAAR